MEKGKIPPRNYPLKWKSEDGNRSGLNYLFNLDKKDIILASVWKNIYCTGYLCRRCKKIIIDIWWKLYDHDYILFLTGKVYSADIHIRWQGVTKINYLYNKATVVAYIFTE